MHEPENKDAALTLLTVRFRFTQGELFHFARACPILQEPSWKEAFEHIKYDVVAPFRAAKRGKKCNPIHVIKLQQNQAQKPSKDPCKTSCKIIEKE